MNRKNEILKELQEQSPQLAEVENIEIFKVSEKYFTELKENIVIKNQKRQNKVLTEFKQLVLNYKFKLSFTIILVIIFTTAMFIQFKNNSQERKIEDYILSNIDSEIIENYLIHNNKITDKSYEIDDNILDEIDEYLITEEL